MNKLLQYGAAALFLGASAANVAHADAATTSGGLKIKTDDGKFEFGIGGRIQLDAVIFDEGKIEELPAGTKNETTSGVYVRRSYLTLTGKLYDWKFKFENDFTAGQSPNSIREMWVSHQVFGGDLIIGQHKPFRSIEELISSNEILLMERPFLTNSLLAGGNRQFQPGIFYKYPITTDFGYFLAQASAYDAQHPLGNAAGQGFGTSERLTWLAYDANDIKLHLGAWGGVDDFGKGGNETAKANDVAYAGRDSSTQVVGPSQQIGGLSGSAETFWGVELAGTVGPVFLQSEYGQTRWEDTPVQADGRTIDRINSFNVQGSVFLTGEKKIYRKDRGTFGNPKVNSPLGAVELVARYDKVVNEDRSAGDGVCNSKYPVAAPSRTGEGCYVQQYTVGANYYVNPAVRIMFNYIRGDNNVTGDNTSSYNARVQLAF